MIICPQCGKENQPHYKFCLGCGGELAGALAAPRSPTGGQGRSASPAEDTNEEMSACPSCGTQNPTGFTFCGNCGTRLGEGGAAVTSHPQTGKEFGRLALIRPDGSEGGSHGLRDAKVEIGRGSGPLFDNDSYLSPHHLRLTFTDGGVVLEDCGSLNGVFVRITSDEPLLDSDIFRVGQELLRFDGIGDPVPTEDNTEILGSPNPGYWGRLSLIVRQGIDGSAFPLMGDEMVLGRERGDILFSDDGYVSGTHAKLSITEDGEVYLTDLGSSNGTFIRLREPRPVPFGTFILMGQQLFRIEAP